MHNYIYINLYDLLSNALSPTVAYSYSRWTQGMDKQLQLYVTYPCPSRRKKLIVKEASDSFIKGNKISANA